MRRRRSDEGSAIVEFVWLGILLLVPLIYIVVAVFEVQRTAYAASAAARSAGRAFVTSPTEASAQARVARSNPFAWPMVTSSLIRSGAMAPSRTKRPTRSGKSSA